MNFISSITKFFSGENILVPDLNRFSLLPYELQVHTLNMTFVIDIFSMMEVSQAGYSVARIALIEKMRAVGYSKAAKEENFVHALGYLKGLFFRISPERKNSVFGLSSLNRNKPIYAEETLFKLPRDTCTEKMEFIRQLDRPLESFGLFRKGNNLELSKEYLCDFTKYFFNQIIPAEACQKLSLLLLPQTYFQKLKALTLLIAVLTNQSELFRECFKKEIEKGGSDLFNESLLYQYVYDTEGNTLLHMAAVLGHIDIIKTMFTEAKGTSAKICLNSVNNFNDTPLDVALNEGHAKVVKFLRGMSSKSQPKISSIIKFVLKTSNHPQLNRALVLDGYSLQNEEVVTQTTAILENEFKNSVDGGTQVFRAIRSLVRGGANISRTPLNEDSCFYEYFSSLERAFVLIKEGDFESLLKQLKNKETQGPAMDAIILLALKKHPNLLNSMNNKIVVPLLHIIMSDIKIDGLDHKQRELIIHWIPEKSEDDFTWKRMTLLTHAAKIGSYELVVRLLEKGWDINLAGEKGLTALHYAIKGNRPDLVDLLIKRNVHLDINFLMYAYQNNRFEIAQKISENLMPQFFQNEIKL